MKYIFFDLDGTLCESKQLVETAMLKELERLNESNKIVLVSGAELSRMRTQCPINYLTLMAQNGNEAYENDQLLWSNQLKNKDKIKEHYEKLAKHMNIEIIPDMVDDRGSQISFSFIGHNALLEVKKKFDPNREIRAKLLSEFPFEGAVIGGTTCIDYIPATKGKNIKKYMRKKNIKKRDCMYIGDAFMNYGNDATVIGVIPTYAVESPLETLKIIKKL